MTKKNDIPKAYYNYNGKQVEIDPKDIIKYEVAEELGVLDKALEKGWKSLSAKETGKIGGLISRRNRKETKWTMNFVCRLGELTPFLSESVKI